MAFAPCCARGTYNLRAWTVILLVVFVWAVPAMGTAGGGAPTAVAGLQQFPEVIRSITDAHAQLYIGQGKTSEQAARYPAMLWYMGSACSAGKDLTQSFEIARDLDLKRLREQLPVLIDHGTAVGLRADALRDEAIARGVDLCNQMAASLDSGTAGSLPAWTSEQLGRLDQKTEPGFLAARLIESLRGPDRDVAMARAWLAELAGRLEALADLDRWLSLNSRWIVENCQWMRHHSVTVVTLTGALQARQVEISIIQSRVEDLLSLTEVERGVWPWMVARYVGPQAAEAVRPVELADVHGELRRTISTLRSEELNLDRRIASMAHAKRAEEVLSVRMREYLPLVSRLEYIQREVAMAAWACETRPIQPLVSLQVACRLSPVSRASLARLSTALSARTRAAVGPLMTDMLGQDYLASYLDLCLYQAAVVETTPQLAVRLNRWVELTAQPSVRGLMDMLHPSPGHMVLMLRADNAYDPRLMKWAQACASGTPMDRFVMAHRMVNAFYRQCGYNNGEPIYTMRDVLSSGLVDCQAGTWMIGAVAAAAGVEGLVPVRMWRRTEGRHVVIGLRDGDRIVALDSLTRDGPKTYPDIEPDLVTLETAVPSLGCYALDEIRIVPTGDRLQRTVPYLAPVKAARRDGPVRVDGATR